MVRRHRLFRSSLTPTRNEALYGGGAECFDERGDAG